MADLVILAGGYTSFIASYIFNTGTNTLTLSEQSTSGDNPSWIALHPTNKSILYAVNEDTVGALQSFAINSATGGLTPISSTGSGGNGPAFAAPLSGGQVAIMNYNSGNGEIITTTPDPMHFGSAATITFPAPVSNPHMALQNGAEVLVPDLGADVIWRLGETSTDAWTIHGLIETAAGSGPRHIAVQENNLFVLNQNTNTLTSQAFPASPNGTSSIISSLSIIPPDPPAGSVFSAAEILFPTPDYSFTSNWIYVSNRNTGVQDPRGDAITVFEANYDGTLTLVDYVYTGLNQIRGMQLGGPNLEYLIAGGYEGGGVAVFERTGTGGNLTLLARNTVLPTRTSFVWLD